MKVNKKMLGLSDKNLNLSFDQYQRYKIVSDIIRNIYKKGSSILEVGASYQKQLNQFMPDYKIKYLDIEIPSEFRNDSDFILGDGTNMDFENESFDIVISIDSLEHISEKQREAYINEMLRVSKKGFIIAAPFNTNNVHNAEVDANNTFKRLTGRDYRWLFEHINNGLPSLDKTIDYIKSKGYYTTVFENGYLPNWLKLIKFYFQSEGIGIGSSCFEELSSFYNKYMYFDDLKNPSYRKVILAVKEKKYIKFNNKIKNDKNFKKDIVGLINLSTKILSLTTERYITLNDAYNQLLTQFESLKKTKL